MEQKTFEKDPTSAGYIAPSQTDTVMYTRCDETICVLPARTRPTKAKAECQLPGDRCNRWQALPIAQPDSSRRAADFSKYEQTVDRPFPHVFLPLGRYPTFQRGELMQAGRSHRDSLIEAR